MRARNLSVLVLLAGLWGCDDALHRQCTGGLCERAPRQEIEALHRERIAMRQQNLRNTAELLGQEERERCPNMAATVEMLKDMNRKDIVTTLNNPERIREWIEDDVRDWERLQPEIRRELEERARGNCPNLERTLPYVIW